MKNPDVSVVIPALNEEGSLADLYARVAAAVEDLDYEIVFIDDGSTDATWARIEQLHHVNPRVRAVRFGRNFGHQHALMAGLQAARGRAVITMDADLQHPPEVIPDLLDRWRGGAMVVHTVRAGTQDEGVAKRMTSRAFYTLFHWSTGSGLQQGMADFRLLDRAVVDQLLRFREPKPFLRGLIHWMGFPAATVTFEAPARRSGETKYSWRRMVSFAASGMTSFSIVPLRVSIVVGFATAALAFAELLYVVYMALLTDQTVPGWASMTGVVSLLIGILFIVLGVIGEYVGRIFEAVQARPLYLVVDSLDSAGAGEQDRSRDG